jgi:uncharacterized protein
MQLDRRTFLASLAGTAAALVVPRSVAAGFRTERFAAARMDDRGVYSAVLFDLDRGDLRSVELPARGHDVALRPDGREWVALARRPGRFGVAVPTDNRPPIWFESKPDRHFFGHGVFSTDGRLLYTTENDYDHGRGVIGVRDATNGYKQIGELAGHGVGPHDVALLSDGRTSVIANGGILTHPDSYRDELNLNIMQPSLVYADLETGDLSEQHKLGPEMHQLSIRHLAVAQNDTVVFGCQYHGPDEDTPPLIGFHRRGEQPVVMWTPGTTQGALRNYIGSVTADASGSIVAASAPRGGLITYWDVAARRFLGTCALGDGCGVAPTHHSASFLLTSGEGWLATGEADGTMSRQSSSYHWDNHAILVG